MSLDNIIIVNATSDIIVNANAIFKIIRVDLLRLIFLRDSFFLLEELDALRLRDK